MTKRYFTRLGLAFICILVAGIQLLHAQTTPPSRPTVIRGKVVDKSSKQPIVGASVILVDKDSRTITGISTDIEGNYSLPIRYSGLRISVSYLGYKTTIPLAIGDKATINFQLESTENILQDIAISGKKTTNTGNLNIATRDLTTATTTIQAKDLEEMSSASIDQALQGRLPGVDIASSSGDPGAPMQIRIRGTSTLNGSSDPLIVVDNMPYDITIPSDFNFANSDENSYGQLLNIAPSDIKEITVLRDGASTAIWGSRAANGVLMITTKRGVKGKPSVNYNFMGSFSKQPAAVPTLNGDEYSTLILEEYYNAGRPFANDVNARQFQYDKNDPANYYNFSNNTDWLGAITQTGYVLNNSVSLQGGGDKAKYYASSTYRTNEGTTVGTNLRNLTMLVNLDYTVSAKILFSTSIQYAHINNKSLFSGSLRDVAYRKMPNQAIYQYDEYGRLSPNYFSPVSTAQGTYSGTYNPLALAETAINHQLGDRITPRFTLRYRIMPNMSLQGQVQFDINNTKVKTFLPQIATGRPFTDLNVNVASDFDNDQFGLSSNLTLNYTPAIGEKHTLTTSMVMRAEDNRNSRQQTASTNTASSFLQDPSIDSRSNSSGSANYGASQNRRVSVAVTAQYSLLDRYILNVLATGEGNSRMGPNHRYTIYPTISGRWRISGESFMKGLKFVDDLSLRVSRSQVGRAPGGDYGYYNNYSSYGYSYLDETGVQATNIELTNLKWETSTENNLGLNLTLFQSRVDLQLDAYKKRTTDQFLNGLQIANYNGYSSISLNGATMDNQGFEVSLSGVPVKTKKWQVYLNANLARNQNVIREISRLVPLESSTRLTQNGVFRTYPQVNSPFGAFYGFRYLGVYPDRKSTIATGVDGQPIVDPSGQQIFMRFAYPTVDYTFQPGDAMYDDVNKDGVIDYKDIVYLGNGNPLFTGGGGAEVRYKGNLSVKAYFTFRTGNDLINGTKMRMTSQNGFDNQSTAVLRRWRKEGDVTDIPRALYASGYNYLGSSRYVEDGSFLRLRSVTARYTFARPLVERLKLKNLSAYVTAEGLFTWTKYTGQDPEVGVSLNGINSVVVDNSTTPPLKTFTLGISANF